MANIYTDMGSDAFDAMAGGRLSSETMGWLQDYSAQAYQTFSNYGQGLIDRSRELYSMIDESSAMQMLRNLGTKAKNVWDGNELKALVSLEELQTASPYQQRYIMAQPDLRQRFLNQEVEGYSDTYENFHGEAVGADHYDYRRVMTGIVDTPNANEDYVCRIFADQLTPNDRELSSIEKFDVLDTWALVTRCLDEGGEDPTSPYGNPL